MFPSRTFAAQLTAKMGLAASVVVLAPCANPRPAADHLTQLCQQEDLTSVSQRLALAGGYHALSRRDLVCAERLSHAARSKDAKDPYAALNLGAIYQRTGRLDAARQEYEEVLKLDAPDSDSRAETAHLATREQLLSRRPADIARHNLALMQR
jgi:Tfp pilus assembly protein PilF